MLHGHHGRQRAAARSGVRATRGRAALVRVLGEARRLRRRATTPTDTRDAVHVADAAAERDRLAAHGPRADVDARGRARSLGAHARAQHALATRHRSRRHRDADGRRAPARARRQDAPRSRSRRVRRARVEVEGGERRRDLEAAARARRIAGLDAHEVHDGPGSVARGRPRRSCGCTRTASSTAPRGSSTGAPSAGRRCRISRSRTKRARTASCSSSPTRSTARTSEIVVATTRPETMLGDTAVAVHPDDDALQAPARQEADASVRRSQDSDHHRRDPGRSEVRHRRGEGHARTRLQRLRDRQATRPRRDQHLQPRRHAQRGGRPVRGLRSQARAHGGEEALDDKGLARGGEAAHADAAAVPALGHRRRADDLDAVVLRDEAAGGRRARGGSRRPHDDHPRGVGEDVRPLPLEHPGLVHLAPAVVGPSDSGVARPERRDPSRAHAAAPTCGPEWTQDPDVLDTWFSSGLWPFSTLGWPDEDRGAREVLSGERSRDRLRHPVLLGRAHDDDGPLLHGRGSVSPRAAARDGGRRDRREDEQGEGQRDRSARSDLRREARRDRGA